MNIPHFFVEKPIEGVIDEQVRLDLSVKTLNHFYALRLKVGEKIILVDGPGHAWAVALCAPPPKRSDAVEVILLTELKATREAGLTLVQGICASDRMDLSIRQVTELGVSRIIPLESERSTVRLDNAGRKRKVERWQRVARAAAEQSGQLLYPEVMSPVDLGKALEMLKDYDILLFFWEEAVDAPLTQALLKSMSEPRKPAAPSMEPPGRMTLKTAIFIGPEGGFSPLEAESILESGAQSVSLGLNILRSETAAVVASALTLYHLGDLGAS